MATVQLVTLHPQLPTQARLTHGYNQGQDLSRMDPLVPGWPGSRLSLKERGRDAPNAAGAEMAAHNVDVSP